MGRVKIFTAVLCVTALAIAATAAAGGNFSNNDYQGHAEKDPGTFVGFDLKKKHGKTKIERVKTGLKYQCTNGETGQLVLNARGSTKVSGNGRFSAKLKSKKPNNPGGQAVLHGGPVEISSKLQNGGKAKGLVGGSFNFNDSPGGGKVRCYSGLVDWKAKRGATVNPVNQDN